MLMVAAGTFTKSLFLALLVLFSTRAAHAADLGKISVGPALGIFKAEGTSTTAAYGAMAQYKVMPKITAGVVYLKSSIATNVSTGGTTLDVSTDRTIYALQGTYQFSDKGSGIHGGVRLGSMKNNVTGSITTAGTTTTITDTGSGFFAGPIAEYDQQLSSMFTAGATIGYMKGFGDTASNQIHILITGKAWLF